MTEDEKFVADLERRGAYLCKLHLLPVAAAVWSVLPDTLKNAPKTVKHPHAPFVYYIRTRLFQVFREPTFMFTGWAFPRNGQPVTALQARVDDQTFFGTYGLAEPEVLARYGEQPENPRPGFKFIVETPPGQHQLSLEARLGTGDWVTIVSLPIWASFSAR